jgi:hypothetical protein
MNRSSPARYLYGDSGYIGRVSESPAEKEKNYNARSRVNRSRSTLRARLSGSTVSACSCSQGNQLPYGE